MTVTQPVMLSAAQSAGFTAAVPEIPAKDWPVNILPLAPEALAAGYAPVVKQFTPPSEAQLANVPVIPPTVTELDIFNNFA
ncbi:MAG: hypothetical protein AAB834_03190, partial [Patescibacteria group bacterium]